MGNISHTCLLTWNDSLDQDSLARGVDAIIERSGHEPSVKHCTDGWKKAIVVSSRTTDPIDAVKAFAFDAREYLESHGARGVRTKLVLDSSR